MSSKEKFYSSLAHRKINEHVLNIWDKFEIKTMEDYHELDLKCDVLVSADVCETFRNYSLQDYELCPSHYLSTPGLSWGAMLKVTKIKLEIIPDPDMLVYFEKDKRGRISYISKRYVAKQIINI